MTDSGNKPPGILGRGLLGGGILGKEINYAAALRSMSCEEVRKRAVWIKAMPIPFLPDDEWRTDEFGNTIRFSHYGDRHSDYGWEIDHARASALGGSDAYSNLRPLHCKVNAGLGGIIAALLDRDR